MQALWEKISGEIDAAAGLVGKSTPLGKRILRVRSAIRRGPNPEAPASAEAGTEYPSHGAPCDWG